MALKYVPSFRLCDEFVDIQKPLRTVITTSTVARARILTASKANPNGIEASAVGRSVHIRDAGKSKSRTGSEVVEEQAILHAFSSTSLLHGRFWDTRPTTGTIMARARRISNRRRRIRKG